MRRKNLKKPGRWSMKILYTEKGQWVEVKDFNEDRMDGFDDRDSFLDGEERGS